MAAISCNLLPWLNTAGLVLGMFGVGIIFFWGPPQPWFGPTILSPDGEVWRQQEAERERKRKLHKGMSEFGLGLIFLGFVCQLFSSLPPPLSFIRCPAASTIAPFAGPVVGVLAAAPQPRHDARSGVMTKAAERPGYGPGRPVVNVATC